MNTEVEKLFDLFAPLYIYLNADCALLSEAVTAVKELHDYAKTNGETLYGQLCLVAGPNDDIPAFLYLLKNKVSPQSFGAHKNLIWKVYNNLFEEITSSVVNGAKFCYDKYGAREVLKANRESIFAGDDYDAYPYYMQAQGLIKRLQDA